jgi:hypothetical protein
MQQELSPQFSNGVHMHTVVQFVFDYECAAPAGEVAAWFGIKESEVYDSMTYFAAHQGELRPHLHLPEVPSIS